MHTSRSFGRSNPDTLVVVQAFAPYADMVRMNMPYWKHHGCPVIISSPRDSFCFVENAVCVRHGEEGHAGPKSLDRWREILEWMLVQPQKYFLMHESDSICLDPAIPRYCYKQPDVLWSNEMAENGNPPTQQFYCVAPWFLSKDTIKKLLGASKHSPDRPPFHGDRWVGQMAEVSGAPHSLWTPGIGCGTLRPGPELRQVCAAVRAGVVMVHGVKTKEVLDTLLRAYGNFPH